MARYLGWMWILQKDDPPLYLCMTWQGAPEKMKHVNTVIYMLIPDMLVFIYDPKNVNYIFQVLVARFVLEHLKL